MCADGPADVLDFDDEEFMGSLSIHNSIMYHRRKTKKIFNERGSLFKNISLMMSYSSLKVELP